MAAEHRIRVGVLFGGESAEHEVSLQSAKNVVEAIDAERYEVVLIGIDRAGRWHLADGSRFLADATDPRRIHLSATTAPLALTPGQGTDLVELEAGAVLPTLDVVFPVLHGPLGEDGTVQGLLRLAHLPFVGPSVLGSAIGMDKDVTKRLLREAGITVAPSLTVRRRDQAPTWSEASAELGVPIFVKPANMGSSVGVSRVSSDVEFEAALDQAFSFDSKILLERAVVGREIECSVLGNEEPQASLPGEVVPLHGFYSYDAKYLDEVGAELIVPAKLDAEVVARVQALSVRVFQTLCCEGMARVDFFLTTSDEHGFDEGELVVNEINTIPGFTRISMFPKLWAASGVSYPDLIDRLISLALERAERETRLASAIKLESADHLSDQGG